jgi:hypothetical protein
MGKEYLITPEQLDKIDHYKRMFELNADLVKELCSSEQHDIVYGFELGKIHSHLRECFLGMMVLESEVANQKVVE